MANEYRLHGVNVQVLRTPEVTNLRCHGVNVQVLRTVATAVSSGRRRQAMVGSL